MKAQIVIANVQPVEVNITKRGLTFQDMWANMGQMLHLELTGPTTYNVVGDYDTATGNVKIAKDEVVATVRVTGPVAWSRMNLLKAGDRDLALA